MARNVYVTTALTGGGLGLDGIDGAGLVKGDLAIFAQKDSTALPGTFGNFYSLYQATTAAKSSDVPEVIWPDVNPGSFNWEKMSPLMPVYHTTGKTATIPNYGIQVIRTTAPTVHVMRRPRRGAYKKLVFATTNVIKVRLTTAIGAYTVKLGQAKKIGSSCCVIISSSRNMAWGGVLKFPNVIELAGRTTGYWEIINTVHTTKKNFTFSSAT